MHQSSLCAGSLVEIAQLQAGSPRSLSSPWTSASRLIANAIASRTLRGFSISGHSGPLGTISSSWSQSQPSAYGSLTQGSDPSKPGLSSGSPDFGLIFSRKLGFIPTWLMTRSSRRFVPPASSRRATFGNETCVMSACPDSNIAIRDASSGTSTTRTFLTDAVLR